MGKQEQLIEYIIQDIVDMFSLDQNTAMRLDGKVAKHILMELVY